MANRSRHTRNPSASTSPSENGCCPRGPNHFAWQLAQCGGFSNTRHARHRKLPHRSHTVTAITSACEAQRASAAIPIRYEHPMSFVDIPVPHGRLEALWWDVEKPRAAAIVCHPHPLHGGTMHNHVTYRLAQAWRDAGVACVRFNFRGVGRSSGKHDEGRGEVDDAKAALDWLAEQTPGVPLYASGFSFGSRAALALAVR